MKRSPQLTPLSHDHHQALRVAQVLRRAVDESEAARTFQDFWGAHGSHHFAIEEDLLLPAWFACSERADTALAARLVQEHLQIRTVVQRVRGQRATLEELNRCGELLAEHVRFEERVVFPRIESDLDEGDLDDLGRQVALAEGAGA
jgi:hemerythrin-like domain-containing protein